MSDSVHVIMPTQSLRELWYLNSVRILVVFLVGVFFQGDGRGGGGAGGGGGGGGGTFLVNFVSYP